MNRLKLLLRNINLLNIILIAIVLLMVNYVVLAMLNINIKYKPTIPKEAPTLKEEEATQSKIPFPSDYTIIAEQNLFHPNRKIPPEKEEKPVLIPEFVLYGTLVSKDISLAYLEDRKSPRTTSGRGKRQIALREGDTLSGYTLKEVAYDKVVMVRGEETLVLKVIDSKVKKDREVQTPEQVSRTSPGQSVRSTPPPPRRSRSPQPTRSEPLF